MQIRRGNWLPIREASRLLGVHVDTVRDWADAGMLPSYRTPGGHRRFSQPELQQFLTKQRHLPPGNETPAERALERVRAELSAESSAAWRQPAQGAAPAHHNRQREIGREMLNVVVQFAQTPRERERLLAEARRIAHLYGVMLAAGGLSGGNAARAAVHFRRVVLDVLLEEPCATRPDAEPDVDYFRRISAFMDEIVLEILDAYA